MFKNSLFLFACLIIYCHATNITPIPQTIEFNYNKAILGKKLFFDNKLSKDNTISCATCHDLNNGGDDGLQFSFGVNGALGNVNAPTVLNSYFNFRQFWDGRAKDLKEQAAGPIENPIEMAHNFKLLIEKLEKTEYKEIFKKIYSNGITKDNIVDAISEFEKTLITPNSRFDKFLLGNKEAISKYEKEGYELFINKGCIACHHGINVGGNHYNKFGAFNYIASDNLGRYEVTKKDEDKYYFKVPSLRNIELTSPYFHDGREPDLKKAVETMSLVQLGRPITNEEIDKIVSFLKTLTGQVKIIE
ncbi:cytochrome B6 [Halarcobacter ebronensis]|uniref:Cytochrome B6 n=1 Tax=Halarcobacter ebronensis TaxID=1462615 RepID=A0A4Q0YKN1_9BACT|nr:cytochrome-c peroxidase [Halarcobacter ebronensis]RXJ69621.1 cytochrome B6 [Halarcobacter ebronensis]